MNTNKKNRLTKKFRRMKFMAGAAIGFMVGAFIPVAAISAVCATFSGLLLFCTLIYFLIVAADERQIRNTTEGIRDARD